MYNKKKKVSCLLASTMLFSLIPAMSAFAASSVSISYSPQSSSGSGSTVGGTMTITNTGSSAIDLSTLTIKNYFTADGVSGFQYDNYYTNAPVAPTVTVSAYSPAITNADTVATFSFGSGSLAAGSSITLNGGIRNGSYSSMNLGNDFTSSTNAPAVFVSGTLVAGKTPVPPATATPTSSPTPTATPTPMVTPTPDPTAFGVIVGTVNAAAGSTVVVPVNVKNVPSAKLDALNFAVNYDTTKLTFVSAAAGSIVPSSASVYSDATTAGTVGILFSDESGANTGAVSAAGTIVNLTFKTAASASGKTPVTIDTTTADGLSAATAVVDSSSNNGEITNIVTTNGSVIFGTPTISVTPTPTGTISISPSSATFANADLKATITAPNKATNPAIGVWNITNIKAPVKLSYPTQEGLAATSTGYTLTLFKAYLATLPNNSVIAVKFQSGAYVTFTVKTTTTTAATISPATGTFTKASPADLTAAITVPNKANNPAIGVWNITNMSAPVKLSYPTQEGLASTSTGYTLTLFKSYLATLPTGSVIAVKFQDGTYVKYTITVK